PHRCGGQLGLLSLWQFSSRIMQTLFADTFYWVALIHAKDQWHRQVRVWNISTFLPNLINP
ncbi:MAG: hypothetical protein O9972_30795, partial [Burkholderiales bacterium]|nr:hypothetical protein [Burkholderiales bacterium]